MKLATRFKDVWSRLGADGDAAQAFARLLELYGEPHRRYHDLAHIEDCLKTLDRHLFLAERPAEVEMALWFHDAIYDTRKKDNEEQSAILADEMLTEAGVGAEAVRRIADHIRATIHQAPPADPDARLVVDIDLSSLAVSPKAFEKNSRKIREEYEWVPDADFSSGRAAFFCTFLARDRIYTTDAFRDEYEARARENLTRGLAAIDAAGYTGLPEEPKP